MSENHQGARGVLVEDPRGELDAAPFPSSDRDAPPLPDPAATGGTPAAAAARRSVLGPMLVGAAMMAVGLLLRQPTASYSGPLVQEDFNGYIYQFLGAYSDITSLYIRDRLWEHPVPYLGYALEYPVGIGALTWWLSASTSTFMGYFLATGVVLTVCGLVLIRLVDHFKHANPWLLALWPTLPLYVALNWDMLALLPMVAALWLFQRQRDGWGALALAAAVWTKFFPIVLLPLIIFDRVQTRGWRAAAPIAGIFGLVSLVVNAPFALEVTPTGLQVRDGWLHFFRFNQERPAHRWSANLWNLADRADVHFSAEEINIYSLLLLLLGIAAIMLLMSRVYARANGQATDLILPATLAVLAWFLAINKVYSVQYSLWIAVLLALVAARSALITALATAFAAADLLYFAVIFMEFNFGWTMQDRAAADWMYAQAIWPATLLRVGLTLAVVGWAVWQIGAPALGWQQQVQPRRVGARLAALAVEYRVPIAAFVVHLLLVAAGTSIGMAWVAQRPPVPALGYLPPNMDGLGRYLVQPLANWDGVWYSLLADRAYWSNPIPEEPAPTAFWPLYPLLLRLGHGFTGLSIPLVGVVLSNLAFLFALGFLDRLVRRDYDPAVATRTIWLVSLFPTAFYFSAVYTESLYLLFTVAAIYAGHCRRWGWAAVAGSLAALTRNTGVLLLLPLGMLLVQNYGWHPRHWWRQAVLLVAIPLTLLVYLVYLGKVWGNPLIGFEAQRLANHWDRYQAWPWQTLAAAVGKLERTWFDLLLAWPSWDTVVSFEFRQAFMDSRFYDLAITLPFLLLTGYTLWRVRPVYSLYALAVLLVPLTSPSHYTPLLGMPRYLIVLFPCFIALALLLRNRWALGGVLLISVVQFLVLLIQFSTWFWVG